MKQFKTLRKSKKSLVMVSTLVILLTSVGLSTFTQETSANYLTRNTAKVYTQAYYWFPDYVTSIPGSTYVIFSWTKVDDDTKYQIQWSKSSAFTSATTVSVNDTLWTLSGATPNTTYYFRVKSLEDPLGAWSNTLTAKTTA